MSPEDRQERIVSLLRAMQKELKVEELSRILEVSGLTVRRDLAVLEERRSIIRTHGGCVPAESAALRTAYHEKVARAFSLKRAIGETAACLVKPGSTILVNDGSTTFHLLSALVGSMAPARGSARAVSPRLSIYTNSIAALAEVGRCPAIELTVIGGRYDGQGYSLGGGFAEAALDSLRVDTVFLGADAIDEKGRLLVGTPEEARLTRAMLRCGRRAILLADHTKVGAPSTMAYGTLADVAAWITTHGIDAASLRRYRKLTDITEARG